MRITIFGTGYVGLVIGPCLADVGHHVVCMDVDQEKIARLEQGELPVYEPGLDVILKLTVDAGTLKFTTDAGYATKHATVEIMAVATPPDETGVADLQHVHSVAKDIGNYMEDHKVVVKSTVPVGTSQSVAERLQATLAQRGSALSFDVVSNPEFLKEGAAVEDFQKPDRIIVCSASSEASAMMAEHYEPFNPNHNRTLYMDVRSAELTKCAANTVLATRISFMNEFANLAERLSENIEMVRQGIGSDPPMGHDFLYSALGYGGCWFPKDVRALRKTADDVGHAAPLIHAAETVNNRQRRRIYEQVVKHFGSDAVLQGRTFTVWGFAFKPNTDDMGEAPSRLIICTEWLQFRAPDFDMMASRMKRKPIFDGRNLYAPERLRGEGWGYYRIGRAPAYPAPQAMEKLNPVRLAVEK